MKFTSLAFAAVLGIASVAQTAPAFAQQAAPQAGAQIARPGAVPVAADGRVARFIVGPMGHVRGLALDNGTLVMIQGRQGDALSQQLAVGTPVHVDGFGFPGATSMIHRATISANGQVVAAPQVNPQHANWQAMSPADRMARREAHRQQREARLAQLPEINTSGAVQTVMAGPRGGVHGVLLSNGATVFLPHGLSMVVRQHGGLRPGETIQVSGRGGNYPQGASLVAQRITFADGSTAVAQ
jgi:hypothetical protein